MDNQWGNNPIQQDSQQMEQIEVQPNFDEEFKQDPLIQSQPSIEDQKPTLAQLRLQKVISFFLFFSLSRGGGRRGKALMWEYNTLI